MNEKTRTSNTLTIPLPAYQNGHVRQPSSMYSYHEGHHELDVFRAARSAFTPSSAYESTHHLPPRPQPRRKRFVICAGIICIIALLGLIIGVVLWRVLDDKASDSSSSHATSGASVTSTPTWPTTDHGPELFSPIMSATTSSQSTVTITPAAFTQTMTLVRADTSLV